MKNYLKKIVSGGQTGVDRAALDAAISMHISYGGWCPKGRLAEDGLIPQKYHLDETPHPDYAERTEWNVRDSDGTLIIIREPPEGGTKLTLDKAIVSGKPYFVLNINRAELFEQFIDWIRENPIRVLNIAGPRESQSPGIYEAAFALIQRLFSVVMVSKKTCCTLL